MKPDPIIDVKNLRKEYVTPAGKVPVLTGVDINIYPGEMVSIMGPSGCGKSTFLYIMGMLQPATSGSYKILGRDVLGLNNKERAGFRRDNLGFVLQTCNLFENSTVYENLEYPLIYGKTPRSMRADIIEESLAEVNLSHRIHHATNRLSGGEQQRVAIARALVNRPQVLLGDEPTGQLDRKTGDKIMKYFEKIVSNKGKAMVLVTHDTEVAKRCTRSFLLEDGVLKEQ
ncbi:ABC transporter ATP-binding protein [Pseudodesulfovibrio methanolicus]|uniref:ABC transporter ATP-binding protein n=1 Tax=Pseudodesulfovibrio methanolicus TaxID=3126690 RepID=A0ABZ2ITY3_9BACT